MGKIFVFFMVIVFCSCKQDMKNSFQESYLPDLNHEILNDSEVEIDSLENGNWKYVKEDKLTKTGNYKDGYKTGSWEYHINNRAHNLYWSVYENSQIKVNYPKRWKIKENKDYLFYSIVNREKKDFFLIKRYSKDEFGLSLDSYLDEAIVELKQRSDERITDYICVKFEFKKRNAYYFRFDTEAKGGKSAYYAFYTEDNNFVYDSTFKMNGESQKLNKEIFGAMVYSLSIDGEKMFHNNDEIIATTQIKIEDFN